MSRTLAGPAGSSVEQLRLQRQKQTLRETVRQAVRALAPSIRSQHDAAIQERVVGLPAYLRARQVLLYVALRDEVSTTWVIERAVADGKALALPCVDRQSSAIRFSLWKPQQPLERGTLSTLQPVRRQAILDVTSLVLIPGRVFDRDGYRIGRGFGYYDRVLDELRRLGPAVGLAYACQVVDSVPREAHDRAVDAVATEAAWFAAEPSALELPPVR